MTNEQGNAIITANAVVAKVGGLPSYTELLAFAERMAYKEAGCLLRLEDFENIARNVIEKNAR